MVHLTFLVTSIALRVLYITTHYLFVRMKTNNKHILANNKRKMEDEMETKKGKSLTEAMLLHLKLLQNDFYQNI